MNQGFSQFIVFVVSCAFAQEVLKLKLQSDKSVPIVGENLILSCLTSNIFKDGIIHWQNPNGAELSRCYPINGGVCDGNNSSYSFTANSSGAYAYIDGLDRARDGGTWKCVHRDASNNNANATMRIVIYTSPIAVNLVQPIPIDVDLGMESITLMCQTFACAFPAPNITWYYMTDGEITPFIGFPDKIVTSECTRQETMYTSTLHLPRGTNFSGNIPFTTKFLCGVTHQSLGEEIKYSNVSNDIIFAVHVSNVNLIDSENGTNVFYEGFPQTLKCVSSPSRPVPIIRWFLRTNNASNPTTCITNNITEIITTDINGLHVTESEITLIPKRDQIYKIFCAGNIYGQQAVESKLVEIDVLYQADQPYVSELGRKFPWLENQTGILSCNTSNYGNPLSQVIWSSHRDMNGRDLIITKLTSNDNGKFAFCQLVNRYTVDKNTTVKSPPITLVIEYSPVIELNITSPLTLNETQSISVLCSATGNPRPDAPTWKRQSGSTLRFENISRNYSGTYTCSVRAKSETNGELTNQKELHVHVQYAPEINVTITGSDHLNMTLNLICEANGFPTNYKFHPWKHMLGNVTIRSLLHGNPDGIINSSKNKLTLRRLSLQDMGTYVCFADNGIRGVNGDVIQASAAVLNVKGMPEVVNRKIDTFAGEYGSSVNICIAFYSDPVISDFKFQRNCKNIENTSRTNMYLRTNVIELVFYNTKVKLAVWMAHLLIQNLTKDDFDDYNLVLENALGKTVFKLQLYLPGTGDEKNPRTHLLVSVVAAMGTTIVALVVVVIALVVVILRKRSILQKPQSGNTLEESNVQGYEVGRGVLPTGEHNTISNKYEGLMHNREGNILYEELQDLSAANTEVYPSNSQREEDTRRKREKEETEKKQGIGEKENSARQTAKVLLDILAELRSLKQMGQFSLITPKRKGLPEPINPTPSTQLLHLIYQQ